MMFPSKYGLFSGIKYHFMVTFSDVIVLNMHFNDTRICPPQKNANVTKGNALSD